MGPRCDRRRDRPAEPAQGARACRKEVLSRIPAAVAALTAAAPAAQRLRGPASPGMAVKVGDETDRRQRGRRGLRRPTAPRSSEQLERRRRGVPDELRPRRRRRRVLAHARGRRADRRRVRRRRRAEGTTSDARRPRDRPPTLPRRTQEDEVEVTVESATPTSGECRPRSAASLLAEEGAGPTPTRPPSRRAARTLQRRGSPSNGAEIDPRYGARAPRASTPDVVDTSALVRQRERQRGGAAKTEPDQASPRTLPSSQRCG